MQAPIGYVGEYGQNRWGSMSHMCVYASGKGNVETVSTRRDLVINRSVPLVRKTIWCIFLNIWSCFFLQLRTARRSSHVWVCFVQYLNLRICLAALLGFDDDHNMLKLGIQWRRAWEFRACLMLSSSFYGIDSHAIFRGACVYAISSFEIWRWTLWWKAACWQRVEVVIASHASWDCFTALRNAGYM